MASTWGDSWGGSAGAWLASWDRSAPAAVASPGVALFDPTDDMDIFDRLGLDLDPTDDMDVFDPFP
ncbi:MAG TPA: hypothetical protein VI172_09435 [Candidatus Dormibacteraeota bacterium]|jgi:hypothetical protein